MLVGRAGKQVNTQAAAVLAVVSHMPHLHTWTWPAAAASTCQRSGMCSAAEPHRRAGFILVPRSRSAPHYLCDGCQTASGASHSNAVVCLTLQC